MTTVRQLRDRIFADSIGKKQNGNFMFRESFFYRHGMTSDKFAANIMQQLEKQGFQAHLIDSGEKYTSFNGGSSIAAGSHWWAEVKING